VFAVRYPFPEIRDEVPGIFLNDWISFNRGSVYAQGFRLRARLRRDRLRGCDRWWEWRIPNIKFALSG